MPEPSLSRRGLLLGLGVIVAAPAIVRVSSLMALPRQRSIPALTFQQYLDQILLPMEARLREAIEKDIMEGSDTGGIFQFTLPNRGLLHAAT